MLFCYLFGIYWMSAVSLGSPFFALSARHYTTGTQACNNIFSLLQVWFLALFPFFVLFPFSVLMFDRDDLPVLSQTHSLSKLRLSIHKPMHVAARYLKREAIWGRIQQSDVLLLATSFNVPGLPGYHILSWYNIYCLLYWTKLKLQIACNSISIYWGHSLHGMFSNSTSISLTDNPLVEQK